MGIQNLFGCEKDCAYDCPTLSPLWNVRCVCKVRRTGGEVLLRGNSRGGAIFEKSFIKVRHTRSEWVRVQSEDIEYCLPLTAPVQQRPILP